MKVWSNFQIELMQLMLRSIIGLIYTAE